MMKNLVRNSPTPDKNEIGAVNRNKKRHLHQLFDSEFDFQMKRFRKRFKHLNFVEALDQLNIKELELSESETAFLKNLIKTLDSQLERETKANRIFKKYKSVFK